MTFSCIEIESGTSTLMRSPPDPIRVIAYVSRNGNLEFKRQDTIAPDDTILLYGDIQPTRAVMTRDISWDIDDQKRVSPYFTTRWSFSETGIHRAVFTVVDRHEDTLRDTVEIFVCSSPLLPNSLSPQDQAWGIAPDDPQGIVFQWQAADSVPYIQWNYRWTLQELRHDSAITIADTLLHQTSLRLLRVLKPLTAYRWTVSVYDISGMPASTRTAEFSTSGKGVEGALDIHLGHHKGVPRNSPQWFVTWRRLDHRRDSLTLFDEWWMRISPLSPGDYQIHIADMKNAEYILLDTLIRILPGQRVAFSAFLSDTSAPQISCPACRSDTLSAFPVQLIWTENGCGISHMDSARLNGISLPTRISASMDTVLISAPHWALSPAVYEFTISAMDCAGNRRFIRYWFVHP